MERLIKILSRLEEKVINLQLPLRHRHTWLTELIGVDDRWQTENTFATQLQKIAVNTDIILRY